MALPDGGGAGGREDERRHGGGAAPPSSHCLLTHESRREFYRCGPAAKVDAGFQSREIASRSFSKKPFETFSGLPVRPPTFRSRAFCSAVRSFGTTTCTTTY